MTRVVVTNADLEPGKTIARTLAAVERLMPAGRAPSHIITCGGAGSSGLPALVSG